MDTAALERWDVRGNTALHVAAGAGNEALVARVLASGVSVDRPRRTGTFTPFHAAVSGVYENVARRLVDAGADVHAPSGRGNCLNLATEVWVGGDRLLAMVTWLLGLGVDPSGGAVRPTPLQNARARQRHDVASLLIQAGAAAG